MSNFTTIRISKKNKLRLDDLGKKCDTHDDIIARMIDDVSLEKKRKVYGKTK